MTFPFDSTGVASTNLITNESHSPFENNYEVFDYIIPVNAPFFAGGLSLTKTVFGGSPTPMVLGVDYQLVFSYLAATNSTTLPIYGGIALLGIYNTTDVIKVTYQTLGGPWVADITTVLANVLTMAYNPRIVSWDQITNVQETFPPIPGVVALTDTTGWQDLINAVNGINTAVASRPAQTFVFNSGPGVAGGYPIVNGDTINLNKAGLLCYWDSSTTVGNVTIPDPTTCSKLILHFSLANTQRLNITSSLANSINVLGALNQTTYTLITQSISLYSTGTKWIAF